MNSTARWLDDMRNVPVANLEAGQVLDVGPLWSFVVAGLATPAVIADERVNETARIGWELIGSFVVCMTGGIGVESLHFMPMMYGRSTGKSAANLLVPPHWATMVKEKPDMQAGAMAYMLSQVRDFWNDRIGEDYRSVLLRSQALEARLLRALDRQGVLTPNEYQSKIMAQHVEGADADSWYEGLPFDMARACEKYENTVEVPFRVPTKCPTVVYRDPPVEGQP